MLFKEIEFYQLFLDIEGLEKEIKTLDREILSLYEFFLSTSKDKVKEDLKNVCLKIKVFKNDLDSIENEKKKIIEEMLALKEVVEQNLTPGVRIKEFLKVQNLNSIKELYDLSKVIPTQKVLREYIDKVSRQKYRLIYEVNRGSEEAGKKYETISKLDDDILKLKTLMEKKKAIEDVIFEIEKLGLDDEKLEDLLKDFAYFKSLLSSKQSKINSLNEKIREIEESLSSLMKSKEFFKNLLIRRIQAEKDLQVLKARRKYLLNVYKGKKNKRFFALKVINGCHKAERNLRRWFLPSLKRNDLWEVLMNSILSEELGAIDLDCGTFLFECNLIDF